jgi:hypothetical protein
MVNPTVHEISHDRYVEILREWQRAAAEQAKARDAASLKAADRR